MVEQTLIAHVHDINEGDAELKVIYNQEYRTIEIMLDGETVCSGDWAGNLQQLFFKAIQLWTSLDDFVSD